MRFQQICIDVEMGMEVALSTEGFGAIAAQ